MPTQLEFIESHPSYVDATNPTNQVIYDWSQESVAVQEDISYTDLIVWASGNGVMRKITEAIALEVATPDSWTEPVYNDLLVLDAMLKGGGDVALSRNDVRGIVSSVSGPSKPLTAADQTALLALSDGLAVRIEDSGTSTKNWGVSLINALRNA